MQTGSSHIKRQKSGKCPIPLHHERSPLGLTHPLGGQIDHETHLCHRSAGCDSQAHEPANRESVTELARATGITTKTLYNWRSQRQ
jgi:hypothetical protein